MMPIASLRLLHVLRLRGTLTAAAAELHLSRSAASHQLALLQREVTVPLTEKVGRGLILTEAGHELADHARTVLDQIEAAQSAVERIQNAVPSGTITIGAIQTAATTILPATLVMLQRRHPQLRIESASMTTEEAVHALPSGRIDVAIVASYDAEPLAPQDGITARALVRDPVIAVLPSEHRLVGQGDPVSLSQLSREPWISGTPDSHFGRLAPSLCRANGFVPDIVHRSDDYAVVAALVAAGQGVALLPASADISGTPGVRVAPLAGADASRDIVLLCRSGSLPRPGITAVVEAITRCSTRPQSLVTGGGAPAAPHQHGQREGEHDVGGDQNAVDDIERGGMPFREVEAQHGPLGDHESG